MHPLLKIKTPRLELIPATTAILSADCNDRTDLGRLLSAVIPPSWPPPLLDDATRAELVSLQETGSDPNFCTWYWILDDKSGAGRTLIGSGGTASCPSSPDTVMIGYSVLDEFQGLGYATEAVHHLIPVIFRSPGVRKILATTYPDLKASIRILEKSGFVPAGHREGGSGMEEGTLAFVLIRPDL
ncbi:GNAT family N-acetyltransferase [Methanoregula sp.]|uniref:GNAT family N-acetyltransferase n=1 Tax=Methanoregula sp. TaxID=2052170 RepID=UPI0035692659